MKVLIILNTSNYQYKPYISSYPVHAVYIVKHNAHYKHILNAWLLFKLIFIQHVPVWLNDSGTPSHSSNTPSLNCYRLVDATELWAQNDQTQDSFFP